MEMAGALIFIGFPLAISNPSNSILCPEDAIFFTTWTRKIVFITKIPRIFINNVSRQDWKNHYSTFGLSDNKNNETKVDLVAGEITTCSFSFHYYLLVAKGTL
jgi:hypothetical protein